MLSKLECAREAQWRLPSGKLSEISDEQDPVKNTTNSIGVFKVQADPLQKV